VTTHPRARAVQAGALLALVGGMLAVTSSPALADPNPPDVQITSISATNLQSGGSTTVQYTVSNTNQTSGLAQITVSANGGMTCNTQTDCSPAVQLGGTNDNNKSRSFTATLVAPAVDAGQTKNFQIKISATITGQTGSANQQVTVSGQAKPQTVRQVNGRVKDQDGKALANASVGLRDSQSHTYEATSNDEGRFSFTSSDAQPILAGNLFVGAVKDGYKSVTVQQQGGAGKTITVTLTMNLLAASASASPSASVTASPPADNTATDAPTAVATVPATDTNNAAQNKSSSSMLFIVLGALLVAAGIGAIVLLVMRRRGSKGGGDPDDPNGAGDPNGPMQPSQGRYGDADATRVASPAGGRMNETMLAGRSGPSIMDAPTMMQQAVPLDDEFPDPYGVPAAPHGGYAGAGGYGTAAAGGYGGDGYGGAPGPAQSGGYEAGPPTQYGRPPAPEDDPYAAYGAPQSGGGYGAGGQPRYDEPTGMYRPEPAAGAYGGGQDQGYDDGGYQRGDYGREPEYPAPANGGRGRGETSGAYQAGGYGGAPEPQQPDQGGYGSWGAPAGGIDSGNGYGPPAGGGYGPAGGAAPAGGTYGGAGEYGAPVGGAPRAGRPAGPDYGDQGGYDPRSTYGRPESYDRGQQPPANNYGGADQGGYGAEQQYGGGGGRQAPDEYYGGADQGGGRHGGHSRQQQPQQPPPPPDSTRPGQRRGLDWLDD
jgi:carboxypeptidase family protein